MLITLHNEQMAPPFSYFGGKGNQAQRYLGHLPPHHTYVEPCCGSAALLFGKPRSKVEVINDLDGDICNLFEVLRDPQRAEILADLVQKTPYSRSEYERCRNLLVETTDPVERARLYFVLIRQSFGSMIGQSWAYGRTSMKSFHGALAMFEPVCQRLQQVQIENLPALTVIEKYDSIRTCFFIDPPYLPEVRVRKQGYSHEMTTEQHVELLDRLKRVKGKVLLCGYPSDLYDQTLEGWRKAEKPVAVCTGDVQRSERPRRTEVLWMNFPDPRLVG